MRTPLLHVTIALALSTSLPGQTVCRPAADAAAQEALSFVGAYTEPADSGFAAARVAMGYPLVPKSQLVVVAQEAVCRKVRDALRTLPGSGFTDRVAVVKAGEVYTAVDPGYFYGAGPKTSNLYVILDKRFKIVAYYGGL